MADRSLTLLFLGKDAGASATAAELAARLKTLQEITDKNTKAAKDQDDQLKKLEKSFKNADRGMNGLLLTALELGPALIPIGAVGAGAIAGLVPAAGAALLAFLGLRDAWKQGTLQATALGKQITIFNGEFEHLKSIAASGVMPGFTTALKEIQPIFPALNRDIALFSTQMGTIAARVAPGLVTLFSQLQPLFQTFGDLLVQGAGKFQQWAASTGSVKTFVAYAQTQLPAVLSTVGNLATTVIHLAEAFAPFGSTSLAAIKLLSQAINTIPVGVLQNLVPVVAGLALGFKAMKEAQAASAGIELLSGKLGAVGLGARTASGVVGTLGKAVGFLGPVGLAAGIALGGLSIIMGRHSQAALEAQKEVNNYTDALLKSSGAIDSNVTKVASQNLAQADAFASAERLGIGQSDLIRASLGQGDALDFVKSKIAAYASQLQGMQAANSANHTPAIQLSDDLVLVSKAVQDQNSEFGKSVRLAKEQKDALDAVTVASQGGLAAVDASARELGVSRDAYLAAAEQAGNHADKIKQDTTAMQIADNQAGLLKIALDSLAGKQLGASEAATALAGSENTARDAIKANHAVFLGNSAAAVANQQAIQQVAEALRGQIGANEAAGQTTKQATDAARKQASQFADNIIKTYGLTGETAKYIRKILEIPAVAPTKAELDKAAASARLAEWRREIEHVPQTKLTTVQAQTAVALASILAVDSALGFIPRYVYTTIVTQHSDIFTVQDAATNRGPAGVTSRAGGGMLSEGWNRINELGPEWLYKSGSAVQVYPHGQTPVRLASGGGGGGDIYVSVNVGGSVVSENDLVATVADGLTKLARHGYRIPQLAGL